MNEKWIFGSVCTKKEKGFCRPKFAGIAAALPTTECTRDQRNINQSYLNADLFSAALLLVLYLQHLWIGQREEKIIMKLAKTWAAKKMPLSSFYKALLLQFWRTLVFILLMSYFVQTPTFNHASPAQLVCRWFRHECKWDILSSKSPTMKR